MMIEFKGRFIIALLVLSPIFLNANRLVLCNDNNIVNSRAVKEIEKIGSEFKQKSGISILLCVKESLNGKKIRSFEANLTKNMRFPYILLTMAKNDKKVDIITSSDIGSKLIDIEDILSPFSGTIIPILAEKKGEDKYSAAMLNGYADIADRASEKLGIKLDSSIGNTNRVLINILRVIIYGSFLYFVIFYIKRKYFNKKSKN